MLVEEIAVTHVPAPPDSQFQRFAKIATDGRACFLWSKKCDDVGGEGEESSQAITDIEVLIGDQEPTEGFEKILPDLNNSETPTKLFLAVSRSSDNPPVVDVKVAFQDVAAGKGFERILKDLLLKDEAAPPNQRELYLCIRRNQDVKLDLKVGDAVDVQDTVAKWCAAEVCDVRDSDAGVRELYVHFKGWSDKWNEWIPITSPRFAPFRTHTQGDTGPKNNHQAKRLDDHLQEFQHSIKRVDRIVASFDTVTDEDRLYVVSQLPSHLVQVLTSVIDDQKLIADAVHFMERSLQVALLALEHERELDLQHLMLVFHALNGADLTHRFYTKYGVKKDDTCSDGHWAQRGQRSHGGDSASVYLINLINTFGDGSGFEHICQRIFVLPSENDDDNDDNNDESAEKDQAESGPAPLALPILTVLVDLFRSLKSHMKATPWQDVYQKFQLAVFERLRHVTDDELKTVDRENLFRIIEKIDDMMHRERLWPTTDGGKSAFQLELDLALRFCRCPFLDKRIFGITRIKEKIESTAHDRNRSQSYSFRSNWGNNTSSSSSASLSEEQITEWILEQNVVQVLLGPNAHEQLINRSPVVLKFLNDRNQLQIEHIDALWQACQGKHESVVRIVFETIVTLSANLNAAQLDRLFEHIKKIPHRDHTELSLQFLGRFTNTAIKATQGEHSKFGLDVLWELLHDDVARQLPPNLRPMVLKYLVSILKQSHCDSFRKHFIEKCIGNLEVQTSVPQSLSMAQQVIVFYGSHPGGHRLSSFGPDSDVAEAIEELNSRMNLLDSFFSELLHYRTAAKAALAAEPASSPRSSTGEQESGHDRVLVGIYAHKSHVEIRLRFLNFILSHSHLQLSLEQFQALWDSLVTEPVTPLDRNILFEWLAKIRKEVAPADEYDQGESHLAFDVSVTQKIFLKFLCREASFAPSAVTEEGFRCFEWFFRFVNGEKQMIRSAYEEHNFQVTGDKLLGVNFLWKICVQCPDKAVRAQARAFLIKLHLRLAKHMDQARCWQDFVTKAINFLAAAHSKQSDSAEIGHVLDIVKVFLSKSQEEIRMQNRRPYHPVGGKTQLSVSLEENGVEVNSITVTLGYENDVGLLRRELAKYCKHTVLGTVLRFKGKVLYQADWDHRKLKYLGVSSGDTIVCDKVPEGHPDADPTKSDPPPEPLKDDHCRRLISESSQHMDVLFDVLPVGGELGQRVWKLITSLPTPQDSLTREDGDGGVPDWPTLLDGNNVLKLLYRLQIIERDVFNGHPKDDEERTERVAWANTFALQGGLEHLYSVLMGFDLDTIFADELTQQCLVRILKVFETLLVGDDESSDDDSDGEDIYGQDDIDRLPWRQEAENFIDFPQFVGVLLDVVFRSGSFRAPNSDSDKADAPQQQQQQQSYRQASFAHDDRQQPASTIQAECVNNATTILLKCFKWHPDLFKSFFAFARLPDIITTGLIQNPIEAVRHNLFSSLSSLAGMHTLEQTSSPLTGIIALLTDALPSVDTHAKFSGRFFLLLSNLLDRRMRLQLQLRHDDIGVDDVEPAEVSAADLAIVRQLVARIKAHPVIERRSADEDPVLRGILLVTGRFVEAFPSLAGEIGQELVTEVFSNCLFKLPSPSTDSSNNRETPPPKCKSKDARQNAFKLLKLVCQASRRNMALLVGLMLPNHLPKRRGPSLKLPSARQLGLPPAFESEAHSGASSSEEKSSAAYVGIKNLGCICYMNSLLQQLFMMPHLRDQVLRFEDTSDNKAESLMYQFQYILAYLQESEKQYVNPIGLCNSFKDWDGNPINVSVQMDANEFLTQLFDKIDECTKDTPTKRTLAHMQGSYAHELLSKDKQHYSERTEPFYFISIDVKKKKSIFDAFDFFCQGEMLEGDNAYHWDDANRKLDTRKRMCIKELPQTLCIHLKRFEFNYETMQKKKLNSRVEFPIQLNMKAFTQEGLHSREAFEHPKAHKAASSDKPDWYYQYNLVGAVVHTGTANSGHYYSFTKERGTGKWFEMNDALVRDFDPDDIPAECFGGEEYSSASGASPPWQGQSAGNMMHSTTEKRRNAFMLFYERAAPPQDDVVVASAAADIDEGLVVVNEGTQRFRAKIPDEHFDRIWTENIAYWRDKWVFDEDYFKFVKDISVLCHQLEAEDESSSSLSSSSVPPYIQLMTRFTLENVCRDFRGQQWFPKLRQVFGESVPACRWFLAQVAKCRRNPQTGRMLLQGDDNVAADAPNWIAELILDQRNPEIRKQVSELIMAALVTVHNADNPDGGDDMTSEMSRLSLSPGDSDSLGAMTAMLSHFALLPEHWKRFPNFFKVLRRFANLGPQQARWLAGQQLVGSMIDMLLGPDCPPETRSPFQFSLDHKQRRRTLGDSWNSPELTHFLAFLAQMICACDTDTAKVGGPHPPPSLWYGVKCPPSPVESSSSGSQSLLEPWERTLMFQSRFLSRLLAEATNKHRANAVSAIVRHWAWYSQQVSNTVVGIIIEGIEENDDEDLLPYFRVLSDLVCMEDTLQHDRTKLVLASLLNVMRMQQRFYTATHTCIKQLIALGRRSPAAAQWFHENADSLDWVDQWLHEHPSPPTSQHGDIKLSKPTSGSDSQWSGSSYNYNSSQSYRYGGQAGRRQQAQCEAESRQFQAHIYSLQHGKPLDDPPGPSPRTDSSSESEPELGRTFSIGEVVQIFYNEDKGNFKARVIQQDATRVYLEYLQTNGPFKQWRDKDDPSLTKLNNRAGRSNSRSPPHALPSIDNDAHDVIGEDHSYGGGNNSNDQYADDFPYGGNGSVTGAG